MSVQAVLAVIAPFLTILVGICVVFLNKYLDVLIVPRNYIFWFRLPSNMRDLKVNMEALGDKKEDIDKKIAEGERQSKSPVSQVEGWKRDVDAIMPKILKFQDDYERCKHNRGFFSIRSNYLDSIECADYLEKVKDLLKRGEFDVVTMDDVSNFTIPTSYEVPGSLEQNCQKAKDFVLNDNSTNVIGIWGMGGVGKTTLLKKVHNLCIQCPTIFDHVIWIVASSQKSNISKVQSEIVKKLKLNEIDDIQSQALIIHNFLKNKNFLLLIDDLWEGVELVDVGIPNTSDRECAKKRKVVFTTREMYVCGNMGARAKETIKVDCLNWEESWLLFKEKVGEQLIQSHPDISKFAEDVAKECKGLPLALITIGRAMSTKKDSSEWKSALNLMRKSQAHDISGTKKNEMQRILKISYDFLDKDLQKCFLSISMWPEDFIITHYQIIERWMGLDIIDNFESMEDAYLRGISYIKSLQAACLLEDAEDEENFNYEQCVKMHDVLRDLSIWIASDCGENKNKWIIKVKVGISSYKGSNIKLKWSEAECISLMNNNITELPLGITCCPDLHTLMLSRNNLTCESILNCFHNFQSLKYLDLFANKLNGFPESICTLTKLQYLNLSENNIDNIPKELGNLKELKYLKLKHNPIRNVPKGVFSELEKLLLLDLFYDMENICGPDVEELKCLEGKLLYLGITVRSGEELNKLMLLSDFHIGALCIKDLNNTSFHFVSIMGNLKNCLERLSIAHSHHSLLKIVFDKDGNQDYSLNVKYLSFINLTTLRIIIWRGLAPKKLFPILKEISFIRCNVLEDVTWIIHLPSLERLHIINCNSMRIAFSNNNYEVDSSDSTFPSLKVLWFYRMPNLQKLSSRFSPAFPQLHVLVVDFCPSLKTLERELIASPKIQIIGGEVKWWDKLKWENDNSRSDFSQIFRPR